MADVVRLELYGWCCVADVVWLMLYGCMAGAVCPCPIIGLGRVASPMSKAMFALICFLSPDKKNLAYLRIPSPSLEFSRDTLRDLVRR